MASKLDNRATPPDLGYNTGIIKMSEDQVSGYIYKYINELSNSGTAEHPGRNLPEFFELVQFAIRSREASEKVPEDKRLLIFADDPPDEEIDTEAITFYLKARGPGQFNRGPANTPRVKEMSHHHRSTEQHPEHPGEKIVTMGRFFDNTIAFNVYARDDSTALRRVLWLEELMDSFRWYFKVFRINALYTGTGDREKIKLGNLKVTRYPMTYFVRTEDIYQFGSQELKQIVLNTRVLTS